MKATNSSHQNLLMPIECLYQGLSINPDAPAAIQLSSQDSGDTPRQLTYQQLTYQELTERVEKFALALQQQCPPGEKIALCAENTIEHLIAFLAILCGGFIWVPINPKNGNELNRELLQTSKPELLLSDCASLNSLPQHKITLWRLDDIAENIETFSEAFSDKYLEINHPHGEQTMGLKFTGGTTGTPKGVIQTHTNVAAVIDNMQRVFEFNAQDRNLAVAPLTHGGSHYILPILAVGGCHLLLPKPDPTLLLSAFRNHRASVSFMPPTLIYKLLEQDGLSQSDFPYLRHLTYSAAPMPPERIEQVQSLLGEKLSTVYGQTEAPMTITALTPQELANPELHTSVGRACHHSEVCVLNNEGEPLTAGETGEVATRGAIVMPGYFEAEDKTRDTFHDDWLLTGDLGFLDENGYLFLQGRSKEMIISGGFNVYPAEVENVLSQHPWVSECMVVGIADDYWGERLEAAICLTVDAPDSLSDEDQTTLRSFVKSRLGPVKTPKTFHRFKQLPRNPVGKVVRRQVLELITQQSEIQQ